MPSDKQPQANRQNAQRSTGPRTPQVKARASLNAVRHGLLARQSVIPEEDRAQFLALLASPPCWAPARRPPAKTTCETKRNTHGRHTCHPQGSKTGSPQSIDHEASPAFRGLMEATASAGPFSEEAEPPSLSPTPPYRKVLRNRMQQSNPSWTQSQETKPLTNPKTNPKRTHRCPSANLRRRRHGSAGRPTAKVAIPRNENAIIAVQGLRSEPNFRPPVPPPRIAPQPRQPPLAAPPPPAGPKEPNPRPANSRSA